MKKPTPPKISENQDRPGRGGARRGAGRKKGLTNRKTAEQMQRALTGGEMPLDYMLAVMRNPRASLKRRDDMAKAAARFCHAAKQSIAVEGGDPTNPVQFIMSNRPPKEER